MKKLTSTLGVFAAAAAIAAAFAMSPAPTKVEAKSSTTDPHWFRLSDGAYLEQDNIPNKQAECGTQQVMDCTVGYEEYDFENNTPLSDPIPLRGDKQLQ